MSYETDYRYRFCGIHVHSLVLVFAIVGSMLAVASSVISFNVKGGEYAFLPPISSFLLYGLVIVANRAKIWILHVTYMALKIVFVIVPFFFYVLVFGFISVSAIANTDKKAIDIADLTIVILEYIYVFVTIFEIVSLVVVCKDYEYVRDLTETSRREVTLSTLYTQPPPQATQEINPNAGWNVNLN